MRSTAWAWCPSDPFPGLSAAGTANTFRELRSMAAGWALEAQAALSEWEVPTDAERARELAELRRLLENRVD